MSPSPEIIAIGPGRDLAADLAVDTECIVAGMSVGQVFLGLLASGPQHGYGMKSAYDSWFGSARALPTGQIYSTLRRLERDDLVVVSALQAGDGPDR